MKMKQTGRTLAGTNSAGKSNIQVANQGNKVNTLGMFWFWNFLKRQFKNKGVWH